MNGWIKALTVGIIVLLVAGCDSDSPDPDGGSDAQEEMVDSGVVSDAQEGMVDSGADATSETPDGGSATGECFAESSATSGDCATICARESACDTQFGTCESGCAVVPKQFDQCSEKSASCDEFLDCLDCTNVCMVTDQCNPPVAEDDCCNGCAEDPGCIAMDQPACQAVQGCL